MEQAVTTKRQRGHRYYYEYELLVFAETLLRAGQVHHASDIADEALAFIKRAGLGCSRPRLIASKARAWLRWAAGTPLKARLSY